MSTGDLPSFLSSLASFAQAVVLPEPCRPARRITVGGWPLKASLESPLPMSSTSSSFTIFTTCCAGVRLSMTCLLYTSDAADDLLCVDLGGRRIIKKKNKIIHQ